MCVFILFFYYKNVLVLFFLSLFEKKNLTRWILAGKRNQKRALTIRSFKIDKRWAADDGEFAHNTTTLHGIARVFNYVCAPPNVLGTRIFVWIYIIILQKQNSSRHTSLVQKNSKFFFKKRKPFSKFLFLWTQKKNNNKKKSKIHYFFTVLKYRHRHRWWRRSFFSEEHNNNKQHKKKLYKKSTSVQRDQ